MGTTAEDAEICLEDDHRGPCYQTLLDLYGLIHARYILTTPGMNKLRRKLQNGVYGCCPNYPDQRVLPIGMSDVLGSGPPLGYIVERGEVVQMPNWGDQLDGAYFGTTSTNLFLLTNLTAKSDSRTTKTCDEHNYATHPLLPLARHSGIAYVCVKRSDVERKFVRKMCSYELYPMWHRA